MSKFFENSTVRDVPELHPDFYGSTAERVQLAWMRSGQDVCAGSGRMSRHPCGHELCRRKQTGRAGGGGAGEIKERLCEILTLIPVHMHFPTPSISLMAPGCPIVNSKLTPSTRRWHRVPQALGSVPRLSPTIPPPSSNASTKFRLFLVLLIHWL